MPRPPPTSSDTLTSITPPSGIDDGLSLTHRLPPTRDPSVVEQWIDSTVAPPVLPAASAVSTSEAYTGSFFDDGADVLAAPDAVPGFGHLSRKFYTRGKPSKNLHEEEWTVEKERALAGDMFRSLARLRTVARVEVKDARDVQRKKERKERHEGRVGAVEDDGRVRIMKPMKWGTFVIEGNDGRVVIVDRHGEFDSGKQAEMEELERRERKHQERVEWRKEKERERAKKEARKKAEEEKQRLRKNEDKKRQKVESKRWERKEKHHRRSQDTSTLKPLEPIQEDDMSEGSTSGMVSPTKFFMTGGQSGWSSTVLSPTKPVALPTFPTRVPPGAWPTPRPSLTKSALSVRSLVAAAAHSTITSVTKSDGPRTESISWGKEASAIGHPSSVVSDRYSDATPSATSAADSSIVGTRRVDPARPSTRRSPEILTSRTTSVAGSIEGWRDNVNKYSSRSPSKRATSIERSKTHATRTRAASVDKRSARSSSRRERPRELSKVNLDDSWNRQPSSPTARISFKSAGSRARSKARSRDSWKNDFDAFEFHIPHKTSRSRTRSRTRSPIASVSAWIQTSTPTAHSPIKPTISKSSATAWAPTVGPERTPSLRSHKSAASKASAITPYSWRRKIEELSDHSTIGNDSPPPLPSPISSEDSGSDGEHHEDFLNGDLGSVHSVKTQSTYHAPTVEDVPDANEDPGAQEWDSAWSTNEDANTAEKKESDVGSARWSGKTGWGGDVAPPSATGIVSDAAVDDEDGDTGGGNWIDKSGYEEDNETWLNAEVEDVKYREAEWRAEPEPGTWRDV